MISRADEARAHTQAKKSSQGFLMRVLARAGNGMTVPLGLFVFGLAVVVSMAAFTASRDDVQAATCVPVSAGSNTCQVNTKGCIVYADTDKDACYAYRVAAEEGTGGTSSLADFPVGWIDGTTCANGITGWAFDTNNPAQSIVVHFYKDAPAGSGGTLVGSTTANYIRDDVNNLFGITGTHGFIFPIPDSLRDNKTHRIYAYGIDSNGGENTRIGNSGKILQCGPAATSIPDQSVTPINVTDKNAPIGWFDKATADGLSGWAFDQDNSTASIDVHFYLDGPAVATATQPAGKLVAYAKANEPRQDVNDAYKITGNHGFVIKINNNVYKDESSKVPDSISGDYFADGKKHLIYAYAIDSNGTKNALLGNNPQEWAGQPGAQACTTTTGATTVNSTGSSACRNTPSSGTSSGTGSTGLGTGSTGSSSSTTGSSSTTSCTTASSGSGSTSSTSTTCKPSTTQTTGSSSSGSSSGSNSGSSSSGSSASGSSSSSGGSGLCCGSTREVYLSECTDGAKKASDPAIVRSASGTTVNGQAATPGVYGEVWGSSKLPYFTVDPKTLPLKGATSSNLLPTPCIAVGYQDTINGTFQPDCGHNGSTCRNEFSVFIRPNIPKEIFDKMKPGEYENSGWKTYYKIDGGDYDTKGQWIEHKWWEGGWENAINIRGKGSISAMSCYQGQCSLADVRTFDTGESSNALPAHVACTSDKIAPPSITKGPGELGTPSGPSGFYDQTGGGGTCEGQQPVPSGSGKIGPGNKDLPSSGGNPDGVPAPTPNATSGTMPPPATNPPPATTPPPPATTPPPPATTPPPPATVPPAPPAPPAPPGR